MSSALTVVDHTLGADVSELVPGQVAYLVRRRTGTKACTVLDGTGDPLTLQISTRRQHFIECIGRRPGSYLLYAIDDEGEEIEGAPVVHVDITPEEVGILQESPHWMRLDRVFDALERSMSAMESKDLLVTQITQSLISSNEALHTNAANLLGTANDTFNVLNGIGRPELDTAALSEAISEKVREKEAEASQSPWFVQLLNGQWGQTMMTFANDVAKALITAQGGKKPTP